MGCRRSRNQSRSCAKESGSTPSRGTGTTGGASRPAPSRRSASTRPASSPTVCASKTARSGSSTPNACRTRDTTRMATSEWPPSAKKLSSAPTRSSPSTALQIPAITSSAAVRGATYAAASSRPSGAGSALRSILRVGVSGSSPSITNAEGTRWSGTRSRIHPRRSLPDGTASSEGTTYATSRRSPGRSSRATTTTSRTPGCRPSSDSTSPGSTRNPRIFTWWSARPRYSMSPPLRQRATSPVRYRRAPASAPSGSGTKRSAVSPGRFRYPRASPAPPTYSSPGTPIGTGRRASSSR